ncbi:MAG: hypothetical protein LUH19_06910 [Lachnospiraceae bacterium]|nr:hypothetical protein [Lachnospiraceae bacterium]
MAEQMGGIDYEEMSAEQRDYNEKQYKKVKAQIDDIITARAEKGEDLKQRKARMEELKKKVNTSFIELTGTVGNISDEALRKEYELAVSSINLRGVLRSMTELIKNMDDGIKRFDRDYISIATIGKEGQGKSRLLQSIGNLENEIIPAYNGTSCTGATSVIWNDPKIPKGSVRAVITFRQPSDLVDIVRPYINTLDPDYLRNNPLEFDDIPYIPVQIFKLKMKEGDAGQAVALKYLSNICDNFEEIRDLFGSSPLTLTDKTLIKTFVAQNNGKSSDDPEAEFYFKYLAVSRADIYCPFFADVGRVRLVDTVGLGSTQYGIEEAMLNTVDRECDAAIVVTRPDRSVQTGDQDLYTSLRDHFRQRDTGKWLFYLVNHYKGQNDNVVAAFREDLVKYGWVIAGSKIVDSSDQEQVRDEFLIPMLQTLLHNMDEIDAEYVKAIDVKEELVRNEIRCFLEELPNFKSVNAANPGGVEAFKKGSDCFSRMSASLSEIVADWGEKKEENNSLLGAEVQKIINNLDSIIPSAETIDEISKKNGQLLPGDMWTLMLHYVRNEITDRFIAIDDVLEKENRRFKNSLVEVLYRELRQLTEKEEEPDPEEEEVDMVEWLKDVMNQLLDGNEQYKQIRKGFQFLYQFNFNTRAQLIQEVRRQLYIINPICDEYAQPEINFKKQGLGYAINFYLTSRMSVIEDELRFHLSRLYNTPNRAFYAAAEEFYDRLTFASDISDEHINDMTSVWGSFFLEFSNLIWKQDAVKYEQVKRMMESYDAMIGVLKDFLGDAA